MMKTKKVKLWAGLLALGLVLVYSLTGIGGGLEPSSPPGPTMKTLDEVEPRIPIHESDLPLTITEPNSYYLAEDIYFTGTTSHAIAVECNDVTIDLAGFTLKGTGTSPWAGIYMHGRANVEIRNGTVRDFSYGIREDLFSGKSHCIIGVRAVSNMDGVYLYSSGNIIKDCIATENSTYGMFTGVASTVTNNNAYENGAYGIYSDIGSTITGNTAYLNGASGFYIGHSSTIIGNTARSNTNYGIQAGGYCLVDQNAAWGNGMANLSAGTGSVLGTNCAP